MHDTPRPHDLLWGMRPEQLPADAPAWAVAVLAAGQPVVVRRARVAVGLVAVGLRGATRDQRLAALMPVEAISHRLVPEDLLARQASEDLPVFRVLAGLRGLLGDLSAAVQQLVSRDLDRAASEAVRRWRFTPAMSNGQPVPGSIEVPFDFKPQ